MLNIYILKNVLGPREWTPYAKWKIREYNELPHLYNHRMNASYNDANAYIAQFPSTILNIIAQFSAYISGAIVGIIALITLNDSNLLTNVKIYNETLLWYLAFFSIILTISRAFIPEQQFIFQPIQLMKQLVNITHYLPKHWRGYIHTYYVKDQFSQLFKSRINIFIDEIICVLLTPFILIFILPNQVDHIITFIKNTVRMDGMGDICISATLQVEKYGNKLYSLGLANNRSTTTNDDNHYQPPSLNHPLSNNNQQPDQDNNHIQEQGKLEKSLLTFVINNPNYDIKNQPSLSFINRIIRGDVLSNEKHEKHIEKEEKHSSASSSSTMTANMTTANNLDDLDDDEKHYEGMPSFDHNKNDLSLSFANLAKNLQHSNVIPSNQTSLLLSQVLNNSNVNTSITNNIYGNASIQNLFSMLEKGYESQMLKIMKIKKK